MLYYSGFSRHLGNVDHGDTITDFLPMERSRGITIQSAAITFNWPPRQHLPDGVQPKTINLIDTPGHQDFRFEVDRCLPVLDGAVCIIDAVKGVEAHTERVWASAEKHQIPRIVFVNKLDRDGASFKRSVLDIASRLNAWPLVCQLPLWEKDERFVGVVDVIHRRGMKWTSSGACTPLRDAALRSNAALWAELETARVKLIERLCDEDDELVEAFSEQGTDLPADVVQASIQRVVRRAPGRLVPVFAGASLRNIGVEPLLDAIVDYLPSPQQAPDVEVRVGGSGETVRLSDVVVAHGQEGGHKTKAAALAGTTAAQRHHHPSVGAVASVFKVVNDPSLFAGTHGMMTFVRVYHGALHKNSQLWNANLGHFEKPFQIAQVSAATIGEIPYLAPGQIGAVTGLKAARTGDTLHILPSHSHGTPLARLRSMTIRPPEVRPAVAFVSVEAYGPSETRRLEDALAKLAREDPSLRWSKDEKLETFVLSGMGQLHLDVAIDRLRTTYKVNAAFSDVQVDYKETLTAPAGPHRAVYDRLVAGRAGQAACTATIEPLSADADDAVSADAAGAAAAATVSSSTLDDGAIEEVHTFARDGNVVRVQLTAPAGTGAFPFDADMVSRQLFNGAYGALARGPRRGSLLHGCRVTVTFDAAADYAGAGSSTDAHIVNAALLAVRQALRTAHAQGAVAVLEPVMHVHIACPDDSAGAIQRDITGARGGFILEVRDAESRGSSGSTLVGTGGGGSSSSNNSTIDGGDSVDLAQVYAPPDPYETVQSLREPQRGVTRLLEIVAKVPLKEMLAYDSRLRSMTGGRHSFTMVLDRFERVVGSRQRDV
ncbi:translation elongation factor [Niveomyces insectorum RCEF 264]|uniref:Elongation factor 2 n=1 Tax=Niveomyces insectorum RCEF 264 TaxID=1081102 RepID=A0A167PUQ0_9HYPO|nr:translation elongation factor [Niveomyces insectorum RCEF 264]